MSGAEGDREATALALHRDRAFDACAAEVLRLYGNEVEGYLRAAAVLRVDPDEVWAATCAAMVEGLPRFEGRSTLRTWLYQVARFTLRHQREQSRRQPDVALSQVSRPSKLEARVSFRPSFLSDGVLAKLSALREELDDDDRTLLYLRVEQAWAWRDIAATFVDEGQDVDQKAAALRKRFERLKEEIRVVLQAAK